MYHQQVLFIFFIASLQILPGTTGNPTLLEFIIYSNATHIAYISVDGSETSAIVEAVNAKLRFDGIKYRLWYTDQGLMYNSKLDGSDQQSFSASVIGNFAVNSVNETIYYIHSVDHNVESVTYTGIQMPNIPILQATDFKDVQVDPYNQSLFLSTDLGSSRNIVRYSLADDMEYIIDNGPSGIATHLTVDETNKIVYWIHFTSETIYNIYRTTYDGVTTKIFGPLTGNFNKIDITEGDDFYYILDSPSSNIKKYNKSSNTLVSNIAVTSGTRNIIVAKDIDECTLNQPCHSNATCNNRVGSFICTCDYGYSGDGFNCSDIDECTLNQPCHANATCNNTVGSFICACDTGYSGDGFNCTDIDECNQPCHSNATCGNTVGSFICTCDTGYSGDGFNCSDIDECTINQPCHANATCNNTVGSFICAYDTGYSGDGFNCTDIDECTLNQPCHSNATCNNTVGSFICTCDTGYSGDGFNCSAFTCKVEAIYYATSSTIMSVFADGNSTSQILAVNNAKLNYDKSSKRLIYYTDTGGLKSVKLDGSDPQQIASVQNITLRQFAVDYLTRKVYYITFLFKELRSVDIDTGIITALNESVGTIKDLDTDPKNNSLVFTTENGDVANGDLIRYFIDENRDFTVYHNSYNTPLCLAVDSENEIIYWVNYTDVSHAVIGTFYNGQTTILKDYNGTTTSVKIAVGENDFYVLDSPIGRLDRFDRENRTFQDYFIIPNAPSELTIVQDLDECCIGGYCHDNASCTNTPGSYICACNEGFTGNSTFCEDINDCSLNQPCHANATCINTVGSYICRCDTGYSGDGFNCIDINECSQGLCHPNASCTDNDGSFSCTCNPGLSGNGLDCQDTPCVSAPCENGGNCSNKGSTAYTCECSPRYTGKHCENKDSSSSNRNMIIIIVAIIVPAILLCIVATVVYITLRKRRKSKKVRGKHGRSSSSQDQQPGGIEMEDNYAQLSV